MTREIPLTMGQVALVDDEDYDWLMSQGKWHALKRTHGTAYYAMRAVRKPGGGYSHQCMHRILMDAPKGIEVDHINGNGIDNRRANLRTATHLQNSSNKHKRDV